MLNCQLGSLLLKSRKVPARCSITNASLFSLENCKNWSETPKSGWRP